MPVFSQMGVNIYVHNVLPAEVAPKDPKKK